MASPDAARGHCPAPLHRPCNYTCYMISHRAGPRNPPVVVYDPHNALNPKDSLWRLDLVGDKECHIGDNHAERHPRVPPAEKGSPISLTDTTSLAVDRMDSQSACHGKNRKTRQGPGRSSFACSNCRRRKTRCDGAHPECKTCSLYSEVCEYELVPSLRYVRQLEARIRELETLVSSPKPAPAQSAPSNGRTEFMTHAPSGVTGLNLLSYNMPYISPPEATVQTAFLFEDFQHRKHRLIHNAAKQRTLELCALSALPHISVEVWLPLDLYADLLEFHWKWIQPFFAFIYRPAFTRDMGLRRGQYFSSFLLYCLLAHSSRFCIRDQGFQLYPHFLERAKSLLPAEIEKQSSVPTIQGMLLLSANATSLGLQSQSWTYSGVAFRMLVDIGGNSDIAPEALSDFPEEDTEVRRRLFWSCYIWDKLTSIYFGREPVLQSSNDSPPPILLDDFAESDVWHDGVQSPTEFVTNVQQSYPPTPSYSISCFVHSCTLSQIINKILLRFYCPSSVETEAVELRGSLTAMLRQWRDSLPSQISVYFEMEQDDCPPSHVATLMCLYHTSMILANRPLIILNSNEDAAYKNCKLAADGILVYAAATIFMLKNDNGQLRSPMAMEHARTNMPRSANYSTHADNCLGVCHDFLIEVSKTCPAAVALADAVQQHMGYSDTNSDYQMTTVYSGLGAEHSFTPGKLSPSAYGALSTHSSYISSDIYATPLDENMVTMPMGLYEPGPQTSLTDGISSYAGLYY